MDKWWISVIVVSIVQLVIGLTNLTQALQTREYVIFAAMDMFGRLSSIFFIVTLVFIIEIIENYKMKRVIK